MGFCSAEMTYQDFLKNLKQSGINTTEIQQKESISRYELTRLLNASECKNCINPDISFISTYTPEYRQTFVVSPDKNFSDITAPMTQFLWTNYFYCVAYVAEQEHMQGYSRMISPICSSRFCGFRNVNRAEFYQVMLNVLDTYIYKNYVVNWKQIFTWYANLDKDAYAYLYLDQKDHMIIQKNKTHQQKKLTEAKELQTYAKYCLFNLSACKFSPIHDIPQWFWPVSQMNILLKNGIISTAWISKARLFAPVSGKEILRSIYEVTKVTQCSFDMDYDKDTITNADDNCPNHFNPHQRDLDADGIGDVCDDDIDGDGQKNLIAVVDDGGNIDITKLTSPDYLGVAIENTKNHTLAPLTTDLHAQITGEWKTVTWDFGDGEKWEGETVTHTFENPWVYTVTVKVRNGNITATDTENIVVHVVPTLGVAIENTKNHTLAPLTTDLHAQITGEWKTVTWDFGDGEKWEGETVNHTFENPWVYTVTVKVSNGNITATDTENIVVRWTDTLVLDTCIFTSDSSTTQTCKPSEHHLWATILVKEIGKYAPMDTSLHAKVEWERDTITWDFGDGEKWEGETVTHTFENPWVYTVNLHVANATDTATASTTLVVGQNPDIQVGLQTVTPRLIYDSSCVTFVPKRAGTIQTFAVDFAGETIEYPASTKVIKYCFDEPWEHQITTTARLASLPVAVASMLIGIGDETVWANLSANNLTPQQHQKVTFTTRIQWCSHDDIRDIVWDFWDGNKERNRTLITPHTYTIPWPHVVHQTITLYNGKKISTALTIYVIDPQAFSSYYLYQYLRRLFWNVGDTVTIFYKQHARQKAIGSVVDNGNWNKKLPQVPNYIQDTYSAGKYLPFSEATIPWNIQLKAHSTFWVNGEDVCVQALKKNTLDSFRCDLDNDGVPDICDTDIDGDGVPNPLHILMREAPNCVYTPEMIDQDALKESFHYPWALDNCFLVSNPGQEDTDQDGKGDSCDDTVNELPIQQDDDWDWDGIKNNVDACPQLPENYNKQRDWDGCPEILEENKKPIITQPACTTCPCNYIHFPGDITNTDRIKAELKSKDKKYLYHATPWLSLDELIWTTLYQ